MLKLQKGGHRELERYYPLLETDFDSEELLGKLAIHRGMMNGSIDFLVLRDEESGMDAGYALMLTKNLYGYVDMKYMAVMPWFRGRGFGVQLMREINKRYADAQGIVAEPRPGQGPAPQAAQVLLPLRLRGDRERLCHPRREGEPPRQAHPGQRRHRPHRAARDPGLLHPLSARRRPLAHDRDRVSTCLPLWGRCPVRTLGGEGIGRRTASRLGMVQ